MPSWKGEFYKKILKPWLRNKRDNSVALDPRNIVPTSPRLGRLNMDSHRRFQEELK